MVFASFQSQTGIDFAHFGLESGMVFEETKEVYERIINKKEREICKFDAKFKKCFCWRSNRSIDDIIPWRTGLKTGVKNFIFWSEIGSGFREPAAHPHHEFPGRSTPLPRVSTPTPTTHPTKQSNLMGRITLLNIQAKIFLISYQITLQIFLFIHFRSTITVTLHPCILCLSLTSLRTSL